LTFEAKTNGSDDQSLMNGYINNRLSNNVFSKLNNSNLPQRDKIRNFRAHKLRPCYSKRLHMKLTNNKQENIVLKTTKFSALNILQYKPLTINSIGTLLYGMTKVLLIKNNKNVEGSSSKDIPSTHSNSFQRRMKLLSIIS